MSAAGAPECEPPPEIGSQTALPSLQTGRTRHRLVQLGSGDVLAVGGAACRGVESDPISSVERLRPSPPQWTSAASMPIELADSAAVLLDADTVLVIAGVGTAGPSAAVLAYEGVSDTWATVAELPEPVERPFATRLSDGSVLLVAGDSTGARTYRLEDEGSMVTEAAQPLPGLQSDSVLTSMPDGGALLVTSGDYDYHLAVYDPSTDTWSEPSTPFDGSWIGAAALLTPSMFVVLREEEAPVEGKGTVMPRVVAWDLEDSRSPFTAIESDACPLSLFAPGTATELRAYGAGLGRVAVSQSGAWRVIDTALEWGRLRGVESARYAEALMLVDGSLLIVGGAAFDGSCDGAVDVQIWEP